MPDQSWTQSDDIELKTRLIQRSGRRYSIRLEQVFWRCLEEAAGSVGKRLNELVAEIAEAPEGPQNLAARLRMFCISYLRERLTRIQLAIGATDVSKIVVACPWPCFVISHRRVIIHANPAFNDLFESSSDEMIGLPLERSFRLSFGRPLSEVWQDLAAEGCGPMAGKLSYMLPGKVFVSGITACPVARTEQGTVSCLVFIGKPAGSAGPGARGND